jgi:hypothetical protein
MTGRELAWRTTCQASVGLEDNCRLRASRHFIRRSTAFVAEVGPGTVDRAAYPSRRRGVSVLWKFQRGTGTGLLISADFQTPVPA